MKLAATGIGIILLLLCTSCKKEAPAPLPTANFYVGNASCSSPCYVHFYDQSYSAKSWKWDFDNGIFSANQNDSTLYNSAGYYKVTLSVLNADSVEDRITKQIAVF